MKRAKSVRIAMIMAILSVPALTGCGSNNGGVASVPGPIYPGYPGAPGVPGQCIPIGTNGGMISFNTSGTYFDGSYLKAGLAPPPGSVYIPGLGSDIFADGQTFGSMVVGAGIVTPPGGYGQTTYTGKTAGGSLITVYNTTGAMYGTNGTLSGYIQLSQSDSYWIGWMGTQLASNPSYGSGGYMPNSYPPGYSPTYMPPAGYTVPGQVCISSIGIRSSVTYGSNWIYNGTMYIYLNNTQHGWPLVL